jgi:YgiT-type zinc finger domain-containing protein
MHLHFITYFTWMGEELVMVPNFPAWICDVCGRREYDEKSIAWLTMLLNPDAGKPSKPRRLRILGRDRLLHAPPRSPEARSWTIAPSLDRSHRG